MIRQSRNLAAVKRAIETCLRSKVDVTVNLGRNKVLSYRGELSGVYPALFTVRPDDERFLGKTSYSYAEVLCGSVQVKRAEQGTPRRRDPPNRKRRADGTRRIGNAAPEERAAAQQSRPLYPRAHKYGGGKIEAAGRRPFGLRPAASRRISGKYAFPVQFLSHPRKAEGDPFLLARLQKRLGRNEALFSAPGHGLQSVRRA